MIGAVLGLVGAIVIVLLLAMIGLVLWRSLGPTTGSSSVLQTARNRQFAASFESVLDRGLSC